MFGIKAFTQTFTRLAATKPVCKFSQAKPLSLNWSLKQTTNMINKAITLPTAALTILNLREILEKSSQESLSIDSLTNSNILVEQVVVLSQISLIDIVGMTISTLANNLILKIMTQTLD